MKILTRKKQDDVLKRLVAIEVIFRHFWTQLDMKEDNVECMQKYVENLTEISYEVGGIKGMAKVYNTIERLFKEDTNE